MKYYCKNAVIYDNLVEDKIIKSRLTSQSVTFIFILRVNDF